MALCSSKHVKAYVPYIHKHRYHTYIYIHKQTFLSVRYSAGKLVLQIDSKDALLLNAEQVLAVAPEINYRHYIYCRRTAVQTKHTRTQTLHAAGPLFIHFAQNTKGLPFSSKFEFQFPLSPSCYVNQQKSAAFRAHKPDDIVMFASAQNRNVRIYNKSEQSYCIAIGSCGPAVLSSEVSEYKQCDTAIYI